MTHKRMQIVEQNATESVTYDVFSQETFNYPQFESLIRSYGFYETWDMELLAARYYYKQSVRQIAHELSYVSKSTVHRHLDKLHKLLIERGFAPKKGNK